MNFENKVIWIIGASSGIGAELVKQLSKQNALLIITSREYTRLKTIEQQLGIFTRCIVLPANMADREGLPRIVDRAIKAYGHIDMVIHSAGVGQRSLAKDTEMFVYSQLMEVNFFGPVSVTQYLLPHFRERGHGHVVVIGSMSGLMGFPGRSGYVASKHALKGYFETLQVEHDLPDFHITIISPGRINTPLSVSALTGDGEPYNKMDQAQLNGIPVAKCVSKILKAISNKKKHVVIARNERLLYWLRIFLPSAYYRIARKRGLQERNAG
jgi:short-subunit dehydrogenase